MRQRGGLVQQGLRNFEDTVRRLAHLEQLGRRFENLIHRARYELKEFGNLGETIPCLVIGYSGDTHGDVAFDHRVQYATEQTGITAEHIRCLNRVLVTGKDLVYRAENTFGQQRLALGHRNLSSWRTTFQQNIDDFLVLDLQLGNGFGQSTGDLVQRKYGLFAG